MKLTPKDKIQFLERLLIHAHSVPNVVVIDEVRETIEEIKRDITIAVDWIDAKEPRHPHLPNMSRWYVWYVTDENKPGHVLEATYSSHCFMSDDGLTNLTPYVTHFRPKFFPPKNL